MMKAKYDKRFGISWRPDCAEEWLELLWAVGVDYDGCNTIESLKGLVDELMEYCQNARKCLRDGKIFEDEEESERSYMAAKADRDKDVRENG